jgi:hypothetical protein
MNDFPQGLSAVRAIRAARARRQPVVISAFVAGENEDYWNPRAISVILRTIGGDVEPVRPS